MAVQVWSVEEFLEKAQEHSNSYDTPEDQDEVNDGPSWLDSTRTLARRAITRGDGVAVYVNEDLGHPEIGQWRVASYGGSDALLTTRNILWNAPTFTYGADNVPVTLPDIGGDIGWRYQLHAIVPSYAQLEVVENENEQQRPIGEAFNDPRVPCCGRDAADCDCSTTLVLPTPELWELRRVWEGGDDAELQRRIVGLVRDIFDGQDGELRRLNNIGPDSVKKPISLQIIDGDTDHFVVALNRPGRVEVSRFSTDYQKVLAHVYEGADVAPDQRPLFAYDGTLTDNEDVER